ncbi:MAG TPA: fluoride efflux transporter CrcB [Azospirillaceae bacterium]|nr:fluoride efflux transporter CrcB [Azospirillaceae bacterium]
MKTILAVALGGAAGSVARYLLTGLVAQWAGTGFPWGTLLVNLLGSAAMGVLAEAAATAWQPSEEMRALLAVGVLGGFTTFSTFSLDAAALLQRGEAGTALAYVAASVLLCVGGLLAGVAATRMVLA